MLYHTMVAVHVTAVCLVVGTLFVQSLAVIFRLRMTEAAQIEGAEWLQHRIYKFIYYPILGIAVATGLYLAMITGAFSNGLWLHFKLVGLLLLVGFGVMNGFQILKRDLPKPMAMFVHIGIFCTSVFMIYMASAKPF